MHSHVLSFIACAASLLACSGSSQGTTGGGQPQDDGGGGGGDDGGSSSGGATVTEHGIVYDYGTMLSSGKLVPVQGLTVTDGNQTTTTDAQGNWSLTLPMGATLAAVVNGTTKGDPYSNLFLPTATAAAGDLDHGNIIIPDQSTFQLERLILTSDNTQAVVHVVVLPTGSCTSVAGGTLTVTSPAGAQVMYFNTTGDPSTQQTSFADLSGGRPVADIFNVTPGADLEVQVNHPTCHQAPFPVTSNGAQLTGQVTTMASEPGDNNSALVVVMQ
jgi:hypothetical protein